MKTIFFGNGLNYLSQDYVSWQQLLDKIKGDNLFENGTLPNTMIYERSIIGNPISFDTLTKKEEAIKKDIASMLKDFPGNPYFDKLAALKAENYLTTNYDYAALKFYESQPDLRIIDRSTEGLYSLRRHRDIMRGNKLQTKMWFLHGEIDNPPSIMLGLDHYCGSVAKIDRYVKGGYEYVVEGATIKTPPILEKLLNRDKFDQSSWVELFFNSNVHIIGFGLDFSEIDIWWLLNKRARFKLDNQTKNLVKNKITYYSTSEDVNHLETLKSLHIDIVKVKLDGTHQQHERAYQKIFRRIESE